MMKCKNTNMYVTSLFLFQMRNALFAEEESTALSTWAVASICGCLRLEHVSIIDLGCVLF
jgi:hypothetical protein